MKHTTKPIAHIISLIVVGLIAAGTARAADTATAPALSSKGASFVKEASAGNQSEITLARLAQERAQNPEVKDLAKMLEQEHQQSQEKLQAIALAHGITLDQSPSWSERHTESKLAKLNGAAFDQQYTKDMLEDHVTDIKKFQKASQQVEDTDVKQYAQETLPHLQTHLQHAESAAKSAGVDQSTIASITKDVPAAAGGTGENQEKGNGAGQKQP